MKKLKGIGASDGIAVAKVYLFVQPDLSFKRINVADIDQEKARFEAALRASTNDLKAIRKKAAQLLKEVEAQVFDAHLMILADPVMTDEIKAKIQEEKVNAESALKDITGGYIKIFENMDDNVYMKDRAADIRDVTKRILAHLLGVTLPDMTMIDKEVVVIAHDLAPSDTAQLNCKFVKAFVTDIGGSTSHSVIMAKSLEIPAIVGVNNITSLVKAEDFIAVNGNTGEVLINPTSVEKEKFLAAGKKFLAKKAEWDLLKDAKTVTLDGKYFELAANIGTPKDIASVIDKGAESIGLYRTEFLYMKAADFPTEEDQFNAYKSVLKDMNKRSVIVRTMDIGGDKKLPYFHLKEEINPFLGFRALRISISKTGQKMFRTQLRALLRASIYGKLRIMFPMVALLQEFRTAKAIYEEEKTKLLTEKIPVSEDIQIGIMVEIPAAAVIADRFAKEVDFLSIGTNDLIQYAMAADRMNEQVSNLYQPYNPAILRLIKQVIDAGHKEGKWVGMCGEMAADQIAVPLLIGMSLDEFSMSATSILKTRSLIKRLDTKKMEELVDQALNKSDTAEEVIALVQKYLIVP
ncbi:MAG: phosphoenolpyruvate--protein phosphotransferase [Streptococcaceae bacterium]|jgi:phosphotransferase system enzyme I (PtsI)|nr:phosphoenolpyruvate--protein phosphotransferase [Streptococcaceae bacterium]